MSVEEQFYLLFPLSLILLLKFQSKAIRISLILLVALLSFLFSYIEYYSGSKGFFFYSHTRIWEFLVGYLAVFIPTAQISKSLHQWLSTLGLMLIIVAAFYVNDGHPYPSVYTLLPVFGTFLIISFAKDQTFVHKVLTTPPFLFIGLISYSLYLWHQPILAFYRSYSLEALSKTDLGIALILMFILSSLNYYLIEKSFRYRFSSTKTFLFFVITAVVFFLFYLYPASSSTDLKVTASKVSNFVNLRYLDIEDKAKKIGDICNRNQKVIKNVDWLTGCLFGDKKSKKHLILLGDSHSQAISWELNKFASQQKYRGIWLNMPLCEPIPYFRRDINDLVTNCKDLFEKGLGPILKNLNADVILTNRWSFRLYPIDGYSLEMPFKNSEGFTEYEVYREYHVLKDDGKFYSDPASKEKALTDYIDLIAKSSNRLFLIYPVPETAIDLHKINSRSENSGLPYPDISIPHYDYIHRNAFVESVFNNYQAENILKIRPEKIFCNSFVKDRCVSQYNSISYYVDDDHLSDQGAKLVIQAIAELSN